MKKTLCTSSEDSIAGNRMQEKTDAELFDEFCRRERVGELATSDNTHPDDLAVCEQFRRFLNLQTDWFGENLHRKYGKVAKVYVDFCSNPQLNAFAARHDCGLHLISINTGALASLGHVYTQLFAHSPYLGKQMQVGNAQRQYGRAQIFARVAFAAACNFLFAHELGHIAYGHTSLIRESRAYTRKLLLEASSCSGGADLLQSMEVDADLHATTSLVNQIAHNQLCGAVMSDHLESPADLLKIAMIAVLTMFHLFYGDGIGIDDYRSASHPLPEIRLMKFWVRVLQMGKMFPELQIPDGDRGVEQLVAEALGSIPVDQKKATFPTMELEGHVNMLDEYKRIRANEDRYANQLNKYAMIRVGETIC